MQTNDPAVQSILADALNHVSTAVKNASAESTVPSTLLVWITSESQPASIHFPSDTLLDPNPLVTTVAAAVKLLNPFACALVHPILTFPGSKPKGDVHVVIETGNLQLPLLVEYAGPPGHANRSKKHRRYPTTVLGSVDTSNLSADDQVRAANIATVLKVQSMQALTFAAPSAGRENAPGAIH